MHAHHWLLIAAFGLSSTSASIPHEPILAPCDRCDMIFDALPADMSWRGVLQAHGEPLEIRGTVRDAAGTPVPNIIVYIHQTDAQGNYPEATSTRPHGALRAWARTDALGRYGFNTIRPGAYPRRGDRPSEPAHVHMMVLEPGRCGYYIDDLLFSDDPLISGSRRDSALKSPRGGRGLQIALRNEQTWQVERDITLGLNVSNYQRCGQ